MSTDYRRPADLKWHREQPFVQLRCPECGERGNFDYLQGGHAMGTTDGSAFYLLRVCPNTSCRRVVFVISDRAGAVLESLPPETMPWDERHLPSEVRDSVAEAVQCLANRCYRASAIMTRRALELMCEDRGAAGKDLRARIDAIGGDRMVVPTDLLDGMHHLRWLGNDAAHVEARHYLRVGEEEASVALELALAILKAVYQHGPITQRLKALGQPE